MAAGLADHCDIQIAYAIDMSRPVSIMVDPFGTEHVPASSIEAAIEMVFDLRHDTIISEFNLRRPICCMAAAYEHFGHELPEFTWEVTNKVDDTQNRL